MDLSSILLFSRRSSAPKHRHVFLDFKSNDSDFSTSKLDAWDSTSAEMEIRLEQVEQVIHINHNGQVYTAEKTVALYK